MNHFFSFKRRLWAGLGATLLAGALYAGPLVNARAADSQPAPASEAKPPKKAPKKAKRQLTGAELYAIHCNRCHPERYATERTDVQWQTLLTHMRVRVNLPATQARAIVKFLQEDSGR